MYWLIDWLIFKPAEPHSRCDACFTYKMQNVMERCCVAAMREPRIQWRHCTQTSIIGSHHISFHSVLECQHQVKDMNSVRCPWNSTSHWWMMSSGHRPTDASPQPVSSTNLGTMLYDVWVLKLCRKMTATLCVPYQSGASSSQRVCLSTWGAICF